MDMGAGFIQRAGFTDCKTVGINNKEARGFNSFGIKGGPMAIRLACLCLPVTIIAGDSSKKQSLLDADAFISLCIISDKQVLKFDVNYHITIHHYIV
jgi:hypothetical protein